MKVLITGGAGFIGGHLGKTLLSGGDQVTVADDLSTGSLDNLPEGAVFHHLDVARDLDALEKLVRQSDLIFHLAAAVGVELVVTEPVRTIETNVDGSANVIRLAARYKKRIFIASTSEVYGKSAKDEFQETDDLLIGAPDHSRWCYACSKLLDEFYLMAYHTSQDLPGTIVRFFNTVGPRQTGRYGMVIPRFVTSALKGEDLTVYGDGEQSRCFCHVADVVRALLMLKEKPESVGQIYNIGSSRLVTISDLAKLVIERTKSSSKIRKIPYSEAYAEGFEDMRRRKPCTEKLHALTGWRPEKTLEEIIDDVSAAISASLR